MKSPPRITIRPAALSFSATLTKRAIASSLTEARFNSRIESRLVTVLSFSSRYRHIRVHRNKHSYGSPDGLYRRQIPDRLFLQPGGKYYPVVIQGINGTAVADRIAAQQAGVFGVEGIIRLSSFFQSLDDTVAETGVVIITTSLNVTKSASLRTISSATASKPPFTTHLPARY